jgi:hypothetical protein
MASAGFSVCVLVARAGGGVIVHMAICARGWYWRRCWDGQNEACWLVLVEYGLGRRVLVGLSSFSFKIHRINALTLPSTIPLPLAYTQ